MNSKALSKLLINFNTFIKSKKVNNEIRKRNTDFTRRRKFVFYDVLYFLIFRCEKCIQTELTKYFCDIVPYTCKDKKGKEIHSKFIYFTNLSEKEFSSEDILSLYSKRWDIECSFKTLKTDYEWERYFSKDCDSETCAILAKVLFHNINGVIRKELNNYLKKDKYKDNKYEYVVNITQLSKVLQKEKLLKYMRNNNINKIILLLENIKDLINKIKVPIRPNRHCKRWGRHASSSKPLRYRIDGRNYPNVIYINGHLQTSKPY